MNILVTGGAGFIGSNFIRQWMKSNPDDKILNLDVLTYSGNLENLLDVNKNKNYEFIKGDICDQKLVNELVRGKDLIIHFAAETHVDRSIISSHDFVHTNVMGTMVSSYFYG